MSRNSFKPPNVFPSNGQNNPVLKTNPPSLRNVNQGSHTGSSKGSSHRPSTPQIPINHPSGHSGRDQDGVPQPVGTQAVSQDNGSDNASGSDTEMASAQSSFGGDSEDEDTSEQDIFKRIPNLFRLLDLIDEHGSGGIVEKIVIDQNSLHRLLNIVQPGSYDSVSKINFKSLDRLSIKATGLYGVRPEIVKYLRQAGCLDDDAATFLSNQISSSNSANHSATGLRSGLYLVLRPDPNFESNRSKQAFIVYWPEESTWDDQAASSSVRRNRVTFMRYLSKLAEQIVALVSPEQANKFVWDTGARNKDLPADQANDDDDESRLFSFEVSKSLEQEEDAISHPGFSIPVEPKHLPKNAGMENVRFVPGEQKAGVLVSINEPARMEHKAFRNETINQMSLEKTIKSSHSGPQIQLGDLTPEEVMTLGKHGLKDRFPGPFQKYERALREDKAEVSRMEGSDRKKINELVERDTPMVRQEVQNVVRTLYDQLYPSLEVGMELSHDPETSATLQARYSRLGRVESQIKENFKLDRVGDKKFKSLKKKWLLIREYLTAEPVPSESDQADFVNDVLNGASELPDNSKSSDKKQGGGVIGGLLRAVGLGSSQDDKPKQETSQKPLSDPSFVALLRPLQGTFPVLEDITKQIYERLREHLLEQEAKILREYVDRIVSGERQHQLQAASEARSINSRRQQKEAFHVLMQELKEAMITTAPHVIWVESLEKMYNHWSSAVQYKWSGTHVIARAPQTRHLLYPLELTEQDSQICQANEDHVPKPKLETRHKFEFTLSTSRNIEFLQLIKDKCLAVISEKGRSCIYIEDNLNLDQSINAKPGKVTLIHDSLGGPQCLFAFDQGTRLLAFIHGGKEPKLSVYIFDELFSGLRSRGSPIPLKGWYDANVTIEKLCFVPGTEEVCLVENSGRARIFSLISQTFRPASLQINSPVIDAVSAPDGSCLLVAVAGQGSRSRLLAFHWASFGKNQNGIHVENIDPSDSPRVVTRFEGRGRNHLLSLSAATRRVNSVAIQVKQKVTEFAFKSDQDDTRVAAAETFNNSLIDCHYEVWTRFPVVPAVSRCTLSPIDRQPRKLVFQSLIPLEDLEQYFARMISSFERTTRKPMDGTLAAISVFSSTDGETSLLNSISEFRFGSFIVELLCLIPLHLAITRDNRFIPLKDGVWDPAYERTLLGADVPAIIDALSLGWYESLFQSYMATKLVRVVSSMGEQSVGSYRGLTYIAHDLTSPKGKSYCLNHFADTSFAGSAMRTTEGVWLSCTPTESYLLVSLDFEGVHSIERSAQEDALLVLFNTAVSNMVLFRNNFALSRDIAGLFTSFQSSAMVLDPNANKGLFNSTLAIIIKDVTNSDAKDIVKEFSLKFRQIVEKEQDQNFISRLHRGRIQIIPWPVINSPGFYTLFRQLRAKLDQQTFTHGTAGAFLHNLKTLMAKIKAQDWGALDQNLAAHRAQQLLERLPRALCDGCTEDGPLKNMDTDEELDSEIETMSFFISEFAGGATPENDTSIEVALQALIANCGPNAGLRQHMQDGEYINVLQDLIHKGLEKRIDRVRHWVDLNVARFPSSNQDIETRASAIQEQFSGMHEAFQYTRYSQVDRRLSCVVPIPPGELTHIGPHTHSTEDEIFHFCDTRCPNCEYLCTLPLGHPQQLHETSHGSMIATRWVVEGDDANPMYELQGRKFGSGDEGAPMLCSLVCAAQGRHAHIDYCRDPANCDEPECEHIKERMHPEPDRPKDWISHGLSWARSGFRDPYSQEEQDEFAKCDVLCAGPEHEATATTTANPSYCTLPIFHAPEPQQPSSMHGHVSLDGHSFNCQNPARLHQAYHIVFVIDDSGSMCSWDRQPLANTPITAQLTASCNNRYGAVLSALYGFWLSRESAASSSSTQVRQDAYSVITFDHNPVTRVANDFTSTTNQLITQLSSQLGCGGTDFHKALCHAQSLIESHWSSDRAPVIVFLSDGECNISDNTVYDLCRTCVRLGKALAFYSVSFGTDAYSASLRQMADIAHEVYATAPQDVLTAARGNPCAYANAIDSIQLADTFLGIASSLQKPRASLIGNSGGRRAIY
ncbi:E3 ubiquitin-protein ligase TRIP12 [Ceratobasidium sp. AG-Ba]|nr:E3 ubiquitin-protein ligase TRIP12 [Ceratobasidium sp. AG-Ba]